MFFLRTAAKLSNKWRVYMKKLVLAAAAAFAAASLGAQMLEEAGVKNTLWTGAGKPLSKSFCYDGVIDVLQARVDVGMFTIDAMINWGAYANWDSNDYELDNFAIGNSTRSPLNFHYTDGGKDKGNGKSNIHETTEMEKYYVNFVAHPAEGLDFGIGTKLNWGMGPAPSYGEGDDVQVWDAKAHARQGGLATAYKQVGEVLNNWDDHGSDYRGWESGDYRFNPNAYGNKPGTTDVAGFVPYANRYALKALAARYRYKDFLEIGVAAPSGMNTDHPMANVGFMIHPADILTLNAVYEGLGQKYGNFYTGVTVDILNFLILDVYMAIDGINFKSHHRGDYWYDPMAYSLGTGILIKLPVAGMSIRPEAAVNWFENDDYSAAFYMGAKLNWEITDKFVFGAWGSYALGSEGDGDEWDSDWGHGYVVDMRPDLTYKLNEKHSFGANVDLEWRHSFDDHTRFCWSTGLFWTYNMEGGITGGKK